MVLLFKSVLVNKVIVKRKLDIFLIILFFSFSWWLMNKSFGYDMNTHTFRIARHQVGDFGLHISLIRSFSWGNNFFPVESPFFPGQSLPYHYYFDFIVGLLERTGARIDLAFNGVSIVAFTLLLYILYVLPQVLFGKNRLLGVLSVLLFVFHSNLTFMDFFKEKGFSLSAVSDLWYLPDYIHKGPFDGSLISLFFTLNVYLNQRHLILAFVMSLSIIYVFLFRLMNRQNVSARLLIFSGIIFGLLSRVHVLTFFSTAILLFLLFLLFKRYRFILPFFIPACLIFLPHLKDIASQNLQHQIINPGFLSEKPLTVARFVYFWFLNIGLGLILIPLGVWFSKRKQRMVFFSILPLFIIGSIFQLSFRIDHNHSIFNFFFIFANFYIAYFLVTFFLKDIKRKLLFVVFIFFLTISGVIDIMAVKNDFQLILSDAPTNKFMSWIINNTNKDSIFLSKQEILDPVTLSGRRNYFGHIYYLSVMGYDFRERQDKVVSYFEANTIQKLAQMRKDNIDYIVLPKRRVVDFNYHINYSFFDKNLPEVYQDNNVSVYEL